MEEMDVLPEELSQITERIIGCAFKVSNTLGIGFVEKVYENALAHEIGKTKLQVKQQYPICVYYDQKLVDEFFADVLVEEKLIEIKRILPSDVWKPAVYGHL